MEIHFELIALVNCELTAEVDTSLITIPQLINVIISGSESFWEPGNYKRTTK